MAAADLNIYVSMESLSLRDCDAIFNAPNKDRYDYFIKRAARTKVIWALWEPEGWLTTTGRDSKERFLVWPDEVFAQRVIEREGKELWPLAVADKIFLYKWLSDYLPDIGKFGDKIWVFPAKELKGSVVSPEDMSRDLSNEIAWLNNEQSQSTRKR